MWREYQGPEKVECADWNVALINVLKRDARKIAQIMTSRRLARTDGKSQALQQEAGDTIRKKDRGCEESLDSCNAASQIYEFALEAKCDREMTACKT